MCEEAEEGQARRRPGQAGGQPSATGGALHSSGECSIAGQQNGLRSPAEVYEPDVHLERLACYRADRAIVRGGKSRGGGICVYIREEWCRDSVVVCKHCSPLVEFVIIKCRPFYLPREFTAILLVAVYIPPSNIEGDRIAALGELYQAVSEQQTAHPDGFTIFARDFNHANLKSVFPRLHQHVPFPTRGDSFLDLVYSAQKGAFKATPLPHLGLSDHLTVLLLPRLLVIKDVFCLCEILFS
nr:uncharacterized protein LOC125979983 [Syngnathus scovelli]